MMLLLSVLLACTSPQFDQPAVADQAALQRDAEWAMKWKKRVPEEVVAKTLGFCIGQSERLKAIELEYPELGAPSSAARIEFDLQFGAALSNALAVDATAYSKLELGMRKQIQEAMAKAPVTVQQAQEFVAEVAARAKGQLPDEVGYVLLSFHPDYDSRPEQEMLAGFKKEVPAADLVRSKGLQPMLQIPASWKVLEPRRPNVVYSLKSKGGHGDLAMTMVVRSMNADELAELKADERGVLDEGIAAMPGERVGRGEFHINDDLVVWGKVIDTQERVGFWIKTVQLVMMFVHDRRLVVMTFHLGCGVEDQAELASDDAMKRELAKVEPLCRLILNSLTFRSDFEEPSKAK